MRKTLIFDADDTLWENNVVFERVIDDYLDWLAHPTLDRAELRAILDDIERANAVVHGYGTAVFLRSLHDCLARLRERPATEQERQQILELADQLVNQQVELIPGVADTLAQLGARHELFLLTKGDREEQQRKIDASGLDHHFSHVHIVREKDIGTYLELVERHALRPEHAWMIGNSPKSDIVPARRAGLNAVFIPSKSTWVLEHDVVDPADEKVLHLARFPELLTHF
ncbi:HAD family hydrolase [Amycolatopsis pithecellobii]|uniref:HAD hydrolase-like protein n=1 Tax=Amycolatopsis pithecellobii TaxID=664692 RepID=A0A6N7YIM2_9PSEU|nr:HAD family hydrolase [Amycolatopsis pithecellobii]MTD52757.1 HAD hydrolase-like protein [Amycolatopsis pithecellobii]